MSWIYDENGLGRRHGDEPYVPDYLEMVRQSTDDDWDGFSLEAQGAMEEVLIEEFDDWREARRTNVQASDVRRSEASDERARRRWPQRRFAKLPELGGEYSPVFLLPG